MSISQGVVKQDARIFGSSSTSGRWFPRNAADTARRTTSCDAMSRMSRRGLLGTAPLILSAGSSMASEQARSGADIPPLSNDGGEAAAAAAAAGCQAEHRKRFRRPPPKVPKTQLAPGLKVSQIIKGCWQLDGQHKGEAASDRTSGAAAVEDFATFASAGITSVDTADIYGPSEAVTGRYMRLYPDAADCTQLLTKVSFFGEELHDAARGDLVRYKVRSSLARLGAPRLQLVQLYWDDFRQRGYVDAALRLAELQAEGLVQHVGLTNFDVPHMLQVIDAGVRVVSNQVQYSVLDRRPQLFMSEFCARNGVAILPYGVLAGGFLADGYVGKPARTARLDTLSKAKYGTMVQQLGGWAWLQELLGALQLVARRHGVSVADVAVRWVLQQHQVPAAIVGARNALHVRDLQGVFTFQLDDIDMLDIEAAYEGATQQPTTDCYVWERGGAW